MHIVGYARRPFNDSDFQEELKNGVQKFSPETFNEEIWNNFSRRLHYLQGDLSDVQDFHKLQASLPRIEGEKADRLYYLATPPAYYETIVNNLGVSGMASVENGYRNILMHAARALHAFTGYGVELEYMIVDRQTLSVMPVADTLLRAAAGGDA